MLSGAELTAGRIATEVDELAARLDGEPAEAGVEVVYEMRYAGQAFELPVPGSTRPHPSELAGRFEQLHEERYGHRDPEGEIVLVHIRLAIVAPGARLEPAAATAGHLAESTSRHVRFDGEWIETTVLRGEPAAGTKVASGPIVFELPEATFVLPSGWSAEVDGAGTIRAEVTK